MPPIASNTAIYAVDPRGLSTGEFDIDDNIGNRQSQEALRSTISTLQTLAENTDGRAIVNRNDLAKGMEQIVRDSSAYYLLGYNSTQAAQDGKFHPIRVRIKRSGRAGAGPQRVLGALGGGCHAGDRGAEGRSAAGGGQGDLVHRLGGRQSPIRQDLVWNRPR